MAEITNSIKHPTDQNVMGHACYCKIVYIFPLNIISFFFTMLR